MGLLSSFNVPNVGQQLQQSNYVLQHPQTQRQIASIQDPNVKGAIETLRMAQIQTNTSLWTLTQGEHPIASREVEEGPNTPKLSVVA